ncbi:8604_t:CDS:2, partial [Cetraspora pellucida]
TIIGELNEGGCLKYRIDVDQLKNVTIDVLAGNLYYEKQNVLVNEGLSSNDELPIISLEHSDNDESKGTIYNY